MKLKEKSTLKSLYTAILSIFLSIAMLLGTTYAWFSTSITTGSNVIISGSFNVSIQYCETFDGTYSDLTDSSVLFNNIFLMPGDSTPVRYIKISNENDYTITATISIGEIDTTGGTSEMHLLAKNNVSEAQNITDLEDRDSLTSGITVFNAIINANSCMIVAIAVNLPTDATQTGVTNSFAIIVGATQNH